MSLLYKLSQILQCCLYSTVAYLYTIYVQTSKYNFSTGSVVVSSVQFQLTSGVNATIPTFTLTCTSTGGPATTVTWRRDGIVITLNATHQQTKRVVDPVMSTYQTILTIDPSVSPSDFVGTYNCTVENVRGRSSLMVIVGELILKEHVYILLLPSLYR